MKILFIYIIIYYNLYDWGCYSFYIDIIILFYYNRLDEVVVVIFLDIDNIILLYWYDYIIINYNI